MLVEVMNERGLVFRFQFLEDTGAGEQITRVHDNQKTHALVGDMLEKGHGKR